MELIIGRRENFQTESIHSSHCGAKMILQKTTSCPNFEDQKDRRAEARRREVAESGTDTVIPLARD